MADQLPVVLAPIRNEDSLTMLSWINQRDQMLFNAAYAPVHEANHADWFGAIQKREDVVIFAIRTVADDRLVGSCQLLNINRLHQNAELQIRIGDPGSRGQGFGAEAVRLLVEFGFRDLNLQRIYLHAFATNARARAVYARTGFHEEGLLRQAAFIDGEFIDVAVMATLRSDRVGRTDDASAPRAS